MLPTATHSKWRETLDGTDTQVVTCAIDRRIYITRERSHEGEDDNSEDTRKFYWWSIRRKEEEFILGRGSRTNLDPLLNYAVDNLVPQRSYLTIDEVLTKAQFLSPFLYQIHCIGPVGFGLAHFYSERPPQTETLQLAPSLGRTCVLVRTIIEQGRAKPLRGNDDGQPTGPQMENCREVPRLAIVWRHVRGPRPHQGSDDPRTS